jgi:rod shape-determining protein MreC
MTFDVRSEGGGVTGVLRTGAQTIVAPLQKAAAFAVNPVVDMIDSLTNVATLREQNIALQRELAEAEAALIAVDDDLARLELYEQLYDLETTGSDIGRTVAQVIGQPDAFDGALIIDKGTSDGIGVGQPVVDTNGYVVGTVQQVTSGTATIVPITVGRDGVAVTVGEEIGVVLPQVNDEEMRLEMGDARQPVFEGDRVVTSSTSVKFPAGYPVGQVTADAEPTPFGALSTSVRPFVNVNGLRVVVVLAWPPDPVTAATEPQPESAAITTTTPATTTTGGDG